MAIKNLDSSLFQDNEPKKPKEGLKINLASDKEEIYDELNKFMDSMPKDVMDQFTEMSKSLSSKLDGMDLGELFNIDIKRVEPKSPAINNLFLMFSKFDEAGFNYDKETENKIIELTRFLENKYNLLKNPKVNELKEEKEDISSKVESNFNLEATLKELTSNDESLFEYEVENFSQEEFISSLNLIKEGDDYILNDLSNLELKNPFTNEKIDTTNCFLLYGGDSLKRTNSQLADRCLLYSNDRSKYIILYAYKKDGNYKFYVPKRGNYSLIEIDEKYLKEVKMTCFKYKTISMCLEQINVIFYLKKNINYSLNKIGTIEYEKGYIFDEMIYLGKIEFFLDDKANDFKKRFDVNENRVSLYLKFKNKLTNDSLNEIIKNIDNIKNKIETKFDVKYNSLKAFAYVEI